MHFSLLLVFLSYFEKILTRCFVGYLLSIIFLSLSVFLSINLLIDQSIYHFLSIRLSSHHLPIFLSSYLLIYLCIYVSIIYHFPIYISIHLCIYLPIIFLSLSIYLYSYWLSFFYLYIYTSVYLSSYHPSTDLAIYPSTFLSFF